MSNIIMITDSLPFIYLFIYLFVLAVVICAAGYTSFQKSCYKVGIDKLSRKEATEECEASGSHLVDIKSFQEQQFVTNLLKTTNDFGDNGDAWIGLYSKEEGGTLTWSDGSTLLFESWHDLGRNHDQMCIRMVEADGYDWGDWECNMQFRYVCEYGKNRHNYVRSFRKMSS